MGKIAIIGATGNYGGKAIEYLLERGVSPSDIVAVYRSEESTITRSIPPTHSWKCRTRLPL